jgi:hypothetical protein
MKSVGEQNISKQERHHILNGVEFVQFTCNFVSVNIMGSGRVQTLQTEEDNRSAAEDNLAFTY